MSEERSVKKVFRNILGGERSVGRSRKDEWTMLDISEERGRKKEARVLHGPYSRWKERKREGEIANYFN